MADDAKLAAPVTILKGFTGFRVLDGTHVEIIEVEDDLAAFATCGSFGCYYGDGRTVQARLTWKW